MSLSQYLVALRKRWMVLLTLALIGASAAFGIARATPPTYQATAKVFVSVSDGQTTTDLVQGSTYVRNLVESYAALTSLPVVLNPVIDELGLDTTARSLSSSITANAPLNTNIIEINAVDGQPDRAASVANAVARDLAKTVADLSPAATRTKQAVTVTVVAPATAPRFAVAPRTRLMLISGLGLGLVGGIALSLVLSLLDTRVKDPRDLDFVGDSAAILGTIPRQSKATNVVLAGARDPLSSLAESYRRLETNLSYIRASSSLQMIVVASATPGEGKTSTAVNLAFAMGETGRRVLLIDGDLRRPAVAEALGLEGSIGLTTVLIGRAELDDVVQPLTSVGIDVLTSGQVPPNPHQLIASSATAELLEQVRGRYDTIIIDSPPLLPVSDGAVLSHLADGALLVVGCNRVRRRDVAAAQETLTSVAATCLGLVVTFAPYSPAYDRYYGHSQNKKKYAFGWPRRTPTSALTPEGPHLRIRTADRQLDRTAAQSAGLHRHPRQVEQ